MKKIVKMIWHWFIGFCKMLLHQLKDPLNFVIFAILWLIFFSPFWFGYILFFVTGNAWHLSYSSAWLGFWSLPFTPALAFIIGMTFVVRKVLKVLVKRHHVKHEHDDEIVNKVFTRRKRKNKLF